MSEETFDYWATAGIDDPIKVTMDDAVMDWVNHHYKDDILPRFLTVIGLNRMEITEQDIDRISKNTIRRLIEDLDDDYGLEDETDITQTMNDATVMFVKTVLKEYNVRACEGKRRERIDLKAWIAEHPFEGSDRLIFEGEEIEY